MSEYHSDPDKGKGSPGDCRLRASARLMFRISTSSASASQELTGAGVGGVGKGGVTFDILHFRYPSPDTYWFWEKVKTNRGVYGET